MIPVDFKDMTVADAAGATGDANGKISLVDAKASSKLCTKAH
jgi:hypothetical protein